MVSLPVQQDALQHESRSQGPGSRAPMFELIPYEKFRDTPAVRFFDITVAESNARDLVIHSGPASAPPMRRRPEPGSFICTPTRRTTCWRCTAAAPSTW